MNWDNAVSLSVESILNWYKIVCIVDLSYKFIQVKFWYIFSVYLEKMQHQVIGCENIAF